MASLDDRVIYINRVSKAISGGSTFSFSTMVAVGDGNGRIGIGIGQGEEVPESITKGRNVAEKELINVPTLNTTIPHEVEARHDAAHVLLKPASAGTGVIAGGAVRTLVELAGIKDILSKSLGSDNPLNIARATLKAFQKLKDPHKVANLRGIPVDELLKENPFGGPSPEEVDRRKEEAEQETEAPADEAGDEPEPEDSSEEKPGGEGAEDKKETAEDEVTTVETS